jgi:hypothetical protein
MTRAERRRRRERAIARRLSILQHVWRYRHLGDGMWLTDRSIVHGQRPFPWYPAGAFSKCNLRFCSGRCCKRDRGPLLDARERAWAAAELAEVTA